MTPDLHQLQQMQLQMQMQLQLGMGMGMQPDLMLGDMGLGNGLGGLEADLMSQMTSQLMSANSSQLLQALSEKAPPKPEHAELDAPVDQAKNLDFCEYIPGQKAKRGRPRRPRMTFAKPPSQR